MSDEKKPEAKDKELKKLTKELLRGQIKSAEEQIVAATNQIEELQKHIQRELGVAGFAKHLLNQFELPEKAEEPKKATELEVK